MKKFSKLAIAIAFVFFASCEKDDVTASTEATKAASTSNMARDNYHLAYGDIVTLANSKTNKFFTGESNGDATINKVWSTTNSFQNSVWLPSAKFKIIDPDNPTSTELIKTGDEISFQSTLNNLYITAESWDDDVSVNRTALGPWEKWIIYEPSNTTVGNTIFSGGVNSMSYVSLKSVWNKYLRPDAANYAKAAGAFDATISVLANPNTFQLTRQ